MNKNQTFKQDHSHWFIPSLHPRTPGRAARPGGAASGEVSAAAAAAARHDGSGTRARLSLSPLLSIMLIEEPLSPATMNN